MHIFIDESGTFAASQVPGAFSLVCGLVIPERHMRHCAETLRHFKVANGFPYDNEIKRKNVSEEAYFLFLEKLRQNVDALAFAVATDASANSSACDHQAGQVAKILENEPRMIYPEGKAAVRRFAETIERLPVQQWIEIFCRTRLVWHIIRHASIYYAFRTPSALGAYRWMFDQKDVSKNQFDETFSSVTLPFTQSLALEEPFLQVEGGQYAKFSRFYSTASYPTWLPEPRAPGRPGNLVDAKLIWREHLAFEDSSQHPGLQLVDLLSNGIYGLLHQRFDDNERAARLLGGLMSSPRRGQPIMDLISLGRGAERPIDGALARLISRMKAFAKPLI
jgi:hypothetical protein